MKSTPIRAAAQTRLCVLCAAQFTGYGNNPAPLAHAGRCCDLCNTTLVIPYRMQPLMMEILMDRLPRNNQ